MLNRTLLTKILNHEVPDLSFKDVHWRTQDSDSNSILFYKILDTEKSEQDFRERIRQAKFGLLVVNKRLEALPANTIIVPESDWPRIQNEVLNVLYPLPAMKLIAVTGTNGKTTTTDLVLQLATLIGKKGMSIGTLGVREYKKTLTDFGLTTPNFIDLRKFLNIYGHDKDFCVMEASSHALVQQRFFGLRFSAAGWLSFSQDHLDYHKSMDEYFEAKCELFKYLEQNAHMFVPAEQSELLSKLQRISPKTRPAPAIESKLPLYFQVTFNRNNLEVARAIVEDVFQTRVPDVYEQIVSIDGRFYIRKYRSNYIVVDFAHTPDALDNICKGIHNTFPGHKLKVLFGCGGDRDRAKRPQMGKAVAKWADEIYLTSDNPRTEDPNQIIDDIIPGLGNKHFVKIVERPTAVKKAFSELKENEVLLLAGKGHEDYILINGVKHPYSDIREVDEFLSKEIQ